MFSYRFLNIPQFVLNISALNHQNIVKGVLPDILTPLTPLGPLQKWRYQLFNICFWFFCMTAPPGGFFHYSQIEARCHLYWFDMYNSDNITFYSQNGWIFKVIQAVSVVIWMESELISPVWLTWPTQAEFKLSTIV